MPLPTRLLRRILPALISLAALPAAAQRPGTDVSTLLNQRFYPSSGDFGADGLQMLFLPPGASPSLVVTNAAGRTVSEMPLGVGDTGLPVFSIVGPQGPNGVHVEEPGTYTMSLMVDGESVGAITYTLVADQSTDPFNPGTTWSAEGPWRTLAYLSQQTARPTEGLEFDYWVSTRETGGRAATIALSLRRGGEEVAHSRSDYTVRNANWVYFDHDLVQPGEGFNRAPFTTSDLAAHDGRYDLVVLANGAPLKTYTVTVEGGQVRPHSRSALDHEPRSGFLSPRLMKILNSNAVTVDAYWVEVAE